MRKELLSSVSPYVRRAVNIPLSAKTVIPVRCLYDYEILYVESGLGTVSFPDGGVEFKTGDILFFRPGEEHSFCILSDLSQPHIHFDLIEDEHSPEIPVSFTRYDDMTAAQRALIRCDLLADIPIPHRIRTAGSMPLVGLIGELVEIFGKRPPFYPFCLKGKMTELLRQLLLLYAKPEYDPSDDTRKFCFIREYIETYHSGIDPQPALTVERIAENFNFSISSLAHGFRDSCGISPIAYYNRVRIRRADELLTKSSISISKIAAILGFDSVYAFSRFYKAHTGISPTEKKKTEN